jgi:ubiquitin carboxyl-terminal hydrolase 4/11/15
MYLTLPLPVQKKWKHIIFYVPWDIDKPHVKVICFSVGTLQIT